MSEWKEYSVGEIVKLEYGKGLKDYRDGDSGYDVFGTNGKIGKTENFLYDQPSVIIGRKGAYREVHYAEDPFFVIDTAFYTKNLIDEIDTTFLYYWFKNVDINAMDSGSAIPSTSRDEVYDLEISLPELSEQNAIAAALSSLDDKIDLLHHQNKTLEALAETLFRQWFVEEAEDSWEDGELGDLVDFVYGKTLKETERSGKGFPVVGSSGIVGYHDEFLVKGPGLVTGRKGTLGKITYLYENFSPIDTTFYITSKSGSASFYFEYFLLQTIHLEEFDTDSAVPGLNRNIALSAEVQVPPIDKISFFNETVDPYFQKMLINQTQIRTLTRLRDTLLPKLMSGEVRVKM